MHGLDIATEMGRWRKRERTGVMAPSRALRQTINGHIRQRLALEGRILGPEHQASGWCPAAIES